MVVRWSRLLTHYARPHTKLLTVPNPGEVFADSAYRGSHFRDAVRAKAGVPRIVATSVWAKTDKEAQAWLRQWNQPIHRVRGRIEKIFGTWKRCYGLRRMRWRGLAKAAAQVHITAIAYKFIAFQTSTPIRAQVSL